MACVMNKRDQKKNGTLGYRITEASSMPKDVILGVPIVTITGEFEMNIENYRGIIEYTDTLIRIKLKSGQLKISGARLEIAYYTNEDMMITGKIEKLEYQ